jgi:extracellular elastinolytic metalloproteinase
LTLFSTLTTTPRCRLVLNAMKMQPCRPGFFEARDAIILADQELTGGENFCTLWRGFSSKGLGPDANVVLRTPWGGGVRTDVRFSSFSFPILAAC